MQQPVITWPPEVTLLTFQVFTGRQAHPGLAQSGRQWPLVHPAHLLCMPDNSAEEPRTSAIRVSAAAHTAQALPLLPRGQLSLE